MEDRHRVHQQLFNLPTDILLSIQYTIQCDAPVVLQVGVEQVLQAVVQAEGDEEAVEVEAEGGAVLRDGWG